MFCYIWIVKQIKKTSQFFGFFELFLFFSIETNQEQKFESTPFSFGDKHEGT